MPELSQSASLRRAWLGLFTSAHTPGKGHLFAIDFARGLGALAVLFWHYQGFFLPSNAPGEKMLITTEQQPLFWLFQPLYRYGNFAVEFFWLISGFVFAATYLGRRVSAWDFSVARFARLYPLHLLTLVIIAGLQIGSLRLVGHEQVYANNDAYHFMLNVFFASSWGFERGFSFNGPIWSVSIEVIIYVVFWLSLPFIFRFGAILPLGVAAAALAIRHFLTPGDAALVANCLIYFFIGSATYIAFLAFRTYPRVILISAGLAIVSGIILIRIQPNRIEMGMLVFLAGLLAAACAVEAADYGRYLQRFRWVGDNTYGTYLWHIPVQITALSVLDYFGVARTVALNGLFLAGFLIVVMVIARASYLYIELPARNRLRRR